MPFDVDTRSWAETSTTSTSTMRGPAWLALSIPFGAAVDAWAVSGVGAGAGPGPAGGFRLGTVNACASAIGGASAPFFRLAC